MWVVTIQPDRRLQDVFCEPLQSSSVPGGHRNICMQTHAFLPNTPFWGFGACAPPALLRFRRLNAITEAVPTLPCSRARGDTGANRSSHQSGEQGIVGGQGILLALETSLFKKPHHASRRSSHDPSHVFGCGRGQREEGTGGMRWPSIHAVKYDAVKMGCQIQS